jgi:hypothetical protein
MRRTHLGALVVVVTCSLPSVPVMISAAQSGTAGQSAGSLRPAQTPQTIPPALAPASPPAYQVDLITAEGSAVFGARWKNRDARIVEVPARPNAAPWTTAYDIQPRAGDSGFDDSSWPTIDAKGLTDRRGGGGLYMTWFRTSLTMPARIGNFDTAGTKAVLSVTIDDYAEIWVNGQLPRVVGMPSPSIIQGFNIPNRVPLPEAKPGDVFQIAILAMNGPISVAPPNPVFFREAKIEFFR